MMMKCVYQLAVLVLVAAASVLLGISTYDNFLGASIYKEKEKEAQSCREKIEKIDAGIASNDAIAEKLKQETIDLNEKTLFFIFNAEELLKEMELQIISLKSGTEKNQRKKEFVIKEKEKDVNAEVHKSKTIIERGENNNVRANW